MALTVDFASAPYAGDPGTVTIMRDRSRSAVLLCDGGGSWGAGIEAAAWSLQYLQRRWSGSQIPELSILLEDIASLHSVIPKELSESEFGCPFSLVLLYCSGSAVRYFASGLFAIVLFDDGALQILSQPNTLGAELIKRRMMSEADASRFRNVGVGPWIPDEPVVPEMSEEAVLAPGRYLLVLHIAMAEKLESTILHDVLSSSKQAAALQVTLGASISVVTVAG